jgi:thioredoxin-like negative regulator of GroEL
MQIPVTPTSKHGPKGAIIVCPTSGAYRSLAVLLTIAGAVWLGKVIVTPAAARYLADRATTIPELRRAVAWDPGVPDLHLRLARAYESVLDQVDLDRARLHLESALQRRPTHSPTWLRLALLADRQGHRARARQAADIAVRHAPLDVSIRWEAALLALHWGEQEPALEHLLYVLSGDPARRDIASELVRAVRAHGFQRQQQS